MATTTRPSSYLSYFRDDFRMESWLLAGACIQTLTSIVLGRMATYLTAGFLAIWIGMYMLRDLNIVGRKARFNGVRKGKWSTKFPHADGTIATGPGEEQIVVFVLAARSNHPRGRFAPGFAKIGEYFTDMWRDLGKNRKTNGFLGKTSTLIGCDQDCNNTMYWLSYWKDLDSLQKFANSSVHVKGLRWFEEVAVKKYPDLGIHHETYNVPAHHWETIMFNTKPIGIATTKYFVADKETGGHKEVDIITQAEEGPEWYRMKDRLRGKSDTNA